MQCNIFYHLSSIVYIASTHVQLAGCDNVKHIENECTKVPIRDWILEKRSKSHIRSSKINGFKELKPA